MPYTRTQVLQLAAQYKYNQEARYNEHIAQALDNFNSFRELYLWKNKTDNRLSAKKEARVKQLWEMRPELLKLRKKLAQNPEIAHSDEFKEAFNVALFTRNGGDDFSATIWKLLLLHLINKDIFPIFDQHVCRAFYHNTKRDGMEIPKRDKQRVYVFWHEYFPWFSQQLQALNTEQGGELITVKKLDEALFVHGKQLKKKR